MFTLYLVICKKPHHFYVGITRNYKRRFWQHVFGSGSEFTRKFGVLRIVQVQRFWNEQRAKYAERYLVEDLTLIWPGSHVAGGGKSSSGCCP